MLLAGIADSLQGIHDAGLVHRDLKPGNVLLALDGPYVIDFGIARALDSAEMTMPGAILGSPGYVAPERIRGEVATGAGDVFALGVTLVYAACGERPFGGGSPARILERTVTETVDTRVVPAEIRGLVDACLAKDPGARPTPRELVDAVDRIGIPPLVGGSWLPDAVADDIGVVGEVLSGPRTPVPPIPPLIPGNGPTGAGGPMDQPPRPPDGVTTVVVPPPMDEEPVLLPPPSGVSVPLPPPGQALPQMPQMPPQAPPSPTRRRVLIGLAAGAGVVAAGAGAAIALSRKGGSGKKAGGAAATGAASGGEPGRPSAPVAPSSTLPPLPPPHGPLPPPQGRADVIDGPAGVVKWNEATSGLIYSLSSHRGLAITAGYEGRTALDSAGVRRWTLPGGSTAGGLLGGRTAVDGTTLYCVAGRSIDSTGRQPGVVAMDLTAGTELWRLPVPQATWEVDSVEGVLGDIVLVVGRDKAGPLPQNWGFVWAVDKNTRQERWRLSGPDVGSLTVPRKGTQLLLGGSAGNYFEAQLSGVDAERGSRAWNKRITAGSSLSIAAAPSMGCWAGGRFVYGADAVRALDPATGNEQWKYQDPDTGAKGPAGLLLNSFAMCVSDPDGKYVFTATGDNVYCLDGASGALRWKMRIPTTGIAQSPWLAYDFGNLYVLDSGGVLSAVDAESHTTRWKHSDPRMTNAMGFRWAASGGTVYVATGSSVTAIDASGLP